MEDKAKLLYIETYGCQMNVADSEVIAFANRIAHLTTKFLGNCGVDGSAVEVVYKCMVAQCVVA